MVARPKNLWPIRKAAKDVHKGRQYVHALIRSGRITARITHHYKDSPCLVVDIDHLRRIVQEEQDNLPVYVPPEDPKRKTSAAVARARQQASARRNPSSKPLHPAAAAM